VKYHKNPIAIEKLLSIADKAIYKEKVNKKISLEKDNEL